MQWGMRQKGNIQQLFAQTLVNNPDIEPGRVVRDPNGTLVSVDDTLLNFGTIDVRGVDFSLKYKYRSPFGVWTPALAGTYTYRYDLSLTPSTPAVNAVSQAQDTATWAPRWKGSASLGWAQDNVAVSAMARYVGPYADYDSARQIGDVWYFDLNGKYTWSRSALGTPFLEMGGVNIFNRLPQVSRYAFGEIGYDPAQADIRGRFLYVRLGAKF
jgi:outer membrane receptor protein involved in Fe transport